jgi:hypothetical protein
VRTYFEIGLLNHSKPIKMSIVVIMVITVINCEGFDYHGIAKELDKFEINKIV